MKKMFFGKHIFLLLLMLSFITVSAQKSFISVKGTDMITPDGKPYVMKGINLGNWLNPEGYMFLFEGASSYRLIDQALKEMVGDDVVNRFWKEFQDNYITEEDIHYIRQTGMNSIRLPFHYKLFTSNDYMGSNNPNRGFELIDRAVKWCKKEGIHIVLDMHDAPGGQTGDNIDDSYGYPWLLVNENNQLQFVEIWTKIAKRYANEPTIIGYDLLNEPIATYFDNKEELNKLLPPLYERVTKEIRKVDKNHIIIVGGSQWNGNFTIFDNLKYDKNIMLTSHIYWCDTTKQTLKPFIDARERLNAPIYMGETGENTYAWIKSYCKLMDENNIGWHFWPFKRLDSERCIVAVPKPANWDKLVEFTKQDRNGFDKIRKNRPNQAEVKAILDDYIEKMKFKNCVKNTGYVEALGLQP